MTVNAAVKNVAIHVACSWCVCNWVENVCLPPNIRRYSIDEDCPAGWRSAHSTTATQTQQQCSGKILYYSFCLGHAWRNVCNIWYWYLFCQIWERGPGVKAMHHRHGMGLDVSTGSSQTIPHYMYMTVQSYILPWTLLVENTGVY